MARRLLVIGAGPAGLVAALDGQRRGFDVTVLEKVEVGDSLRRWGRTRFFTPLRMNLPEWTRALLRELSPDAPSEDEILTGPEMAERVLIPLASRLGARLKTRHEVIAVGRARLCRGDLSGHPVRFERPFRVLVDGPDGETTIESDLVLDASGVYGRAVPAGAGGLFALGERSLGGAIIRHLGTMEARLSGLAGQRVLLVGHGHSAANAVLALDALGRAHPDTRITWAVRTGGLRPCVEVASDPLPERKEVASRANALAQAPPAHLRVERRAHVERFAIIPSHHSNDSQTESDSTPYPIEVTLTGNRTVTVDAVVALTGYRPDLDILSELAIDISPATEGAAGIARAFSGITDCLAVPSLSESDLQSGEPGFFLIGAKSYGRARTFLLSTGFGQISAIFDLAGKP